MNITKIKAVDSVLKSHKPFFINIGNYRDISVQNRPLSAHFWPVKFWSRDWTPPKLGLHKAYISTHIVSKFQLCTSSGFGIISDLITFEVKNYHFFMFFLCLNSRSRNLGSPKSAHNTLSLFVMLSPNLNFLGFTVG